MTHNNIGWAVETNENIDVRSVSETRRAAIVNWLVTQQGHHITILWTDDDIEQLWDRYERSGARVIEVNISPLD